MSTSEARLVERVVDTSRYPLSEPGSSVWKEVVSHARRALLRFGCCVMRDFIRPSSRHTLCQQGAQIAPLAHYDVESVNAYNVGYDTSLPDGHPAHISMERGNAFVARDHIPAGFIIHQLYVNELFQRFIAGCVELPEIHPLADPLAGLCLNVVRPGGTHPWHFDTNELAVSILTQSPQRGGVFEYCPNIRSAQEENLDDVWGVINGRRDDLVRRLTVRPGDLQLFLGRYSLHRVRTVHGSTARHSAIFAYCQRSGVVGRPTRTKQLFGRLAPEHLAADGQTIRSDQLLD